MRVGVVDVILVFGVFRLVAVFRVFWWVWCHSDGSD